MFGSYLPKGQTLFGVDVLGVCENEMKKITVGVFDYVLGVCENHGMVVVVFKGQEKKKWKRDIDEKNGYE